MLVETVAEAEPDAVVVKDKSYGKKNMKIFLSKKEHEDK